MQIHLIKSDGAAKCGINVYTDWQTGERRISSRRFILTTNDPDKVTCKKCSGNAYKSEPVPIAENYLGQIFYTSWGYDMTLHDYAKVIKQDGAVLTLQECFMHSENDNGFGAGRSWPGEINPAGKVFRIRQVKTKNGYVHFTKANGHFWYLWNGKKNYYNTWD